MVARETGPTRLEYLIPGRIGTTRILRPAMRFWRNFETDESEACRSIGHGHAADSDLVMRANDFYRAFWTSVMTTALIPFLLSGLAIKAISGRHHPNTAIACLLLTPWALLLFTALLLVALGFFRTYSAPTLTSGSDRKRASIRPAGISDDGEDFWIALAGGIVVAALLVVGMILA